MVGDIHAFMSNTIPDCYCGETHLNQQGNVAVSEVVDSDALDTGSGSSSGHFPVQTILCTGEDPFIRLYRIQHFQVILHFFYKKIRHLYGTIALGSLRIGDYIPAFQPLIGFGDRHCLTLEVKVSRSQCQQLTFPNTAPVQHFKGVVELGILHGLLRKLTVVILGPDFHFLGSGLTHIANFCGGIGYKSVVFAGVIENRADLIVDGFQIRRGEGFSVFVLAVQNLILPCEDVFGKNLAYLAVFEMW